MSKYDDIIQTEWPKETMRPRMPLKQRAKIFLPFAALTGYDKSLDETLSKRVESMKQKTGSIQYEDILPETDGEII